MASTSETGHDVNLANYKLIITRIGTFTNYAPANPSLLIPAMTAQSTAADAAHSSYLEKLDDTKEPINEREIEFVNMKKLVTRANNIFRSSVASKASKRDAAGLMKRILGRGVKVRYLPDGKIDPKWISNSQQSYVKMTKNYEQFVNVLDASGHYEVNEPILKMTNLKNVLTNLQAKNNAIDTIIAAAIEFRTKRDHLLYDLDTGIIDVSLLCKNYVKGLFGAGTPEAKSITSIYLKRVMTLDPADALPTA
jgi:hypothetical protein